MRRTETIERVLGVDPGTRQTGWGIVDRRGRNLTFCAGGVISTTAFSSLPERLRVVYAGIAEVIEQWTPHTLSLEKAFVAYNVQSAFRLGEARGVILLVQKAVFSLLGKCGSSSPPDPKVGRNRIQGQTLPTSPDATDALAAAVCHCHTSPLATQIQTQLAALAGGRRKRSPRSWRQVSGDSLAPERVVGGSAKGRG